MWRPTGSTNHIDTGLGGQWSSSANLDTVKACRALGGLLLGISAACEPTSTTGPNDILRYGAAGHIFLGWVPLAVSVRRPPPGALVIEPSMTIWSRTRPIAYPEAAVPDWERCVAAAFGAIFCGGRRGAVDEDCGGLSCSSGLLRLRPQR